MGLSHIPKNKKLKNFRIASEMASSVDTLLSTASAPSISMPLFDGVGPIYDGDTFIPNTDCWLDIIRPQLTGVPMYAGIERQSFGMFPLGGRYVLNCGHYGPEPYGDPDTQFNPLRVKYVNVDGTVWETTVTHRINDAFNRPSDDGHEHQQADLMVYVLAEDPPSWVYKVPIANVSPELRQSISDISAPYVVVSQGNQMGTVPFEATPNNRMVYVNDITHYGTPSSRDSFFHIAIPGDSGTVRYILHNNILYMVLVVLYSGYGYGCWVADYAAYLNHLIYRASMVSGAPLITVAPVTIQ